MPNLDGTRLASGEPRHAGPLEQGPMTERRKGRCVDNKKVLDKKAKEQNNENKDVKYGYGCGGRRRGRERLGNRLESGFSKGFGRGKGRGHGRGFGNI